jgi:LysW-gamma-L-alpha-aminoadipyl-6-phosphate/LysW-L-glutamyl-5-phosphate reductase
MIQASIVGGSGYAGGELLRLLLGHGQVEVKQVTSETYTGSFVHSVHPNLRSRTKLKFSALSTIEKCDLLFLALPHGQAMGQIERFAALAPRIVDLSADFRLRDPALFEKWYGHPHAAPQWLSRFVYGLPELHREELRTASYVSGVGCNATASNLALLPLFRAGLVDKSHGVIVDIKVGSSEGGNTPSLSSHHPERSGAVRSFAPSGHRHTAEIIQEMGLAGDPPTVHLSLTAIELVRGVLATAHVFLKEPTTEKDLWQVYRSAYGEEPFVRLVKDRKGIYRYPEPKLLAGTNYADIGFEWDEAGGRVISISAIDNLMKGAAGSAVQCMNVMHGWPETTGLDFPGLHPI